MVLRSLFGVAVIAFCPLAAAGTLDVGPLGSGAAFSSIQDAVLAALPGDVILVQPGIYSSVGPIVIDKSLTIIGAGSGVVFQTASSAFPGDQPISLSIKDLTESDEVRVSGMRIDSVVFTGLSATTLSVLDCEGAVFLSDIVSRSGINFNPTLGSGLILNSAQVSMDGCDFAAESGAPAGPTGSPLFLLGQAGLLVVDSNLSINNSNIAGADGGLTFTNLDTRTGGKGISALNSTVRVARSEIRGGTGGVSWFNVAAGAGGAAISGTGSKLYLRGGPGNMLVGGDGLVTQFGPPLFSGAGGSAVVVAAGSLATAAADVVLIPGVDGLGVTLAPTLDLEGGFVPFAENLASVAVLPRIAAPGASIRVELAGEPGASAVAFFSLNQAPGIEIPGVFGAIVVNLGSMLFFAPQILDAAGLGQSGFSLPSGPALIGQSALFQALTASSLGLTSLSAPALLSVK